MAAATLAAVGVLALWLIAGHGLWERNPRSRPLGPPFTAATVVTVVSGVLVFYAVGGTILGMVAGAVGSGLEDSTTVRAAACRSRQQERRAQLPD